MHVLLCEVPHVIKWILYQHVLHLIYQYLLKSITNKPLQKKRKYKSVNSWLRTFLTLATSAGLNPKQHFSEVFIFM